MRDWLIPIFAVLFIIAIALIVYQNIRNNAMEDEAETLESNMAKMDSLLTIYQTQLTACRADRDELGYAVVGLFKAVEVRQ